VKQEYKTNCKQIVRHEIAASSRMRANKLNEQTPALGMYFGKQKQ